MILLPSPFHLFITLIPKEYIRVNEQKNNARLKMLQRKTRSNIEEARTAARKVYRKKKKYYEEEKLEELQEKYKRNRLKQFYEGICKIRTGFQPRTTMCSNKQGVIVREEKDVLEVWATYFKELLNPKGNQLFRTKK